MKETWRDIAGYEGFYQVSNLGRVRGLGRYVRNNLGLKNMKGQILRLHLHKTDYLMIRLYRKGMGRTFFVARLVAQAFIPNPDGLLQVDHINEKTADNRAVNLQWITCQENIERSRAKTYFFISPAGKRVEIFNMRKYCRNRGLNSSHMCQVHLGRYKQHKGWRAA